jgi:aryl-alcohol dehydrogenase-like predicted oxidoreductase
MKSVWDQRALGRTGLQVTRLGFGAMELRGPRIWDGRLVRPAAAERILNAVLDLGINFIDTSPDYGRSEEYIGRFLSRRRDEYVLATKCGCRLLDRGDHDETRHVWTRENLLRNVDESLRKLKTDHVDILQLHNPTAKEVRDNDVVSVLQEIRESKKAHFVGVSAVWPDVLDFIKMDVFDTIQTTYSALDRTHEDLISFAAEQGRGTLVRGALVKGALTDLERRNLIENIRKTVGKKELWEELHLEEVLGEMQPVEFLLRFALTHLDIDVIVVGTLDPNHLREDVSAAERGPLPSRLYDEVKCRLSTCGVRPIGGKE